MTETNMTLIELLQKHDQGDFLRAVTESVLQTLMEHDVEGVIGAGRYERGEDRQTYRNGYRDRALKTRMGALNLRVPKLLVDECTDILTLIGELTDRITAKTKLLASLASASETARRLQTMPGVGPMTALAVEAFAPNLQEFRSGRDFAAWLGLVPKQHSSGGKERLGRVSKAGQTDIRRLLIIGAMSRVIGRGARNVAAQSWLGRLMHRKPKMLAAKA